jgi:tRNA A-37 threonylcarbamoyl transferase component Bud32
VSRTSASDAAPPDLRGYRFIKHIGSGGNAQVYLYEQDLPHRKVAVKVLNESTLSEAARHRFTAEANVTAGLAHRHIVQVFDAAVTGDGRPYIVMPYYPQPNLSVRARRSHFSVADVLRIGIQIGSAVETSHRHDVLHHDIKPQNVLTDSYGEPALTDFGIATTKGGDGPAGLSVPWSPPEILYGTAPGDQRSDVYSLGATLWHLLVGRSPFEQPGGDNSTFALMGRIKSEPPPRTQRADIPDSLERLLRQAMAKEPSARPQSAMELIRGLQSIEQELRLPLTQPILPSAEPSGDTRGGDTITRARARDGDTGFGRGRGPEPTAPGAPPSATESAWGPGGWRADPRTQGGRLPVGHPVTDGQPPWGQTIAPPWSAGADQRTQGAPSAWSGGAGAGGWQGGAETDPTRRRGPVRVDPSGGPGGGGAAAAGPRFHEPPPGERDGTTMVRPAVLGPGGQGGGHRRHAGGAARRGGRALALTVGGVLLVAAGAAFFLAGRGHGQQSPQATGTGQSSATAGAQSALGPGASAPGEPTVTAAGAGGTQVKFSWTYGNPAAGDTFRWQRVSGTAGTAGGVLAKPQLVLSLPQGQALCVVVQVRRAGGQASEPSAPACWPN